MIIHCVISRYSLHRMLLIFSSLSTVPVVTFLLVYLNTKINVLPKRIFVTLKADIYECHYLNL